MSFSSMAMFRNCIENTTFLIPANRNDQHPESEKPCRKIPRNPVTGHGIIDVSVRSGRRDKFTGLIPNSYLE